MLFKSIIVGTLLISTLNKKNCARKIFALDTILPHRDGICSRQTDYETCTACSCLSLATSLAGAPCV